jgi:hypothetical protein
LAALEPAAVPAAAAVRARHRYPSSRCVHPDYRSALAPGLPSGSEEIESAHRYLVRQRHERPGSWRTSNNAEAMAALRIARTTEH